MFATITKLNEARTIDKDKPRPDASFHRKNLTLATGFVSIFDPKREGQNENEENLIASRDTKHL